MVGGVCFLLLAFLTVETVLRGEYKFIGLPGVRPGIGTAEKHSERGGGIAGGKRKYQAILGRWLKVLITDQ